VKRSWLLVASALVALLATTAVAHAVAPAPPFETNLECLQCHSAGADGSAVSKVDFAVSSGVDLDKCAACHRGNYLEFAHPHFTGACENCHNNDDAFYFPWPGSRQYPVNTPYGHFLGLGSLSSTPAKLHAVHSQNGSWVSQSFDASYPACASCHAPAACTACHADPVAHGEHAAPTFPGRTLAQANGVAAPVTTSTCIDPACHSLAAAGTPAFIPSCGSCHPRNTIEHGYEAPMHTADVTATVDSGGKSCGDCHRMELGAEHQRTTSSSKAAGCGACHPAVRATFSAWDQTCTQGGCHPQGSATAAHGTIAAGHAPLTTGDAAACASCHAGDLGAIHIGAVSEANPAKTSCMVCHSDSAVPTIKDCTSSECHGTSDPHPAHLATESDDPVNGCLWVGCHYTTLQSWTTRLRSVGDLNTFHANAPAGKCAVCHANPARGDITVGKTTYECAQSGCHADKSPIDPNHYPSVTHETTDAVDASGFACSDCHYLNVKSEHDAFFHLGWTCTGCHQYGYYAVAGTYGAWNKTCGATGCHSMWVDGASTPAYHTRMYDEHDSQSPECAGADCHNVSDVKSVHADATLTQDGVTYTGCKVCHTGPEKSARKWTARCTECHSDHGNLGTRHAATASPSCANCHEVDDVRSLHASATAGPCKVCHDNPDADRIGDLGAKTAECGSCHSSEGSDYHRGLPDKHDYSAMPATCQSSTCHPRSLPDAHQPYLARYPEYATTCELCHVNTDPGRIPVDASAACESCHASIHPTMDHSADNSQACVDCHETGDVMSLHGSSGQTGCDLCHGSAARVTPLPSTVDCVNCHAAMSPTDPNHYGATDHATTDGSEAGYACSACHDLDLKAEHAKASVSPAVSCVLCHQSKVDALTTAWNQTCATCHATRHDAMAAKHTSTKTACGGTGCHAVGDVAVVHAGSTRACGVCHGSGTAPATDCATAGCHPLLTGNHEPIHDTAGTIDAGCKGCHFEYLTKEHAAFGYTCATCHSSTNTAVRTAISAGDRSCEACHPAVNGKDYHLAQSRDEFNTGNSSGHRVAADLPGMRSSFRVNSATYSWSLPTASSFLKAGWTTDAIVTCDKCHTYTGAAGPHGSTAKVNVDPAYPADYQTAYLGSNGPSPSNVICAKCHTNLGNSNNVHGESDHEGSSDGKCIRCHAKIPHGWRLPRMLAYTNDPAAYSSTGLTGIRAANHTPSGWGEQDCATSCGEHSSSLSGRWPSTLNTVGTLKGSVRSTTGGVLAGVLVTTDQGHTATTNASGTYDLGSLPTGTYQVTAAIAGYVAQTTSVSVTANKATVADFVLAAAPPSVNLSQGKAATASTTYSSTYAASKAVDGSTGTYWRSTSTGSQWVRVDLGSSQSFKRFVVDWNGSSYARAYRIETSSDGSNWTSRYSTSSGNGDTTVTLVSAVTARYVRLYCTGANSYNYQVTEWQVWSQ